MARLARLRFVCIGHPDARIDDLTLDFRDGEGRATDSTLWLRNGGGKSSLLNLFFSLVQPYRRQFLGGKAEFGDRQLEEYVKPDDHAAVVAEWELPDQQPGLGHGVLTPTRFLTGVFYEWRAATGDEGSRQLRRHFFSSRVDEREPRLTLDGLPFYQHAEGRQQRRSMSNFLVEWRGLRGEWPQAEVATVDQPKDWAQILDGVGIDADLFRYQIRMNVEEGGADNLFSFTAVDKFVEFFLELVLDPNVGEQITQNIGTFRDALRRRAKELMPERALLLGLTQRLEPLRAVAAERSALRGRLRAARGQLRDVDQYITGRTFDLRRQIQRERETEREAAEADQALRDDSTRQAGHALSLKLFAARQAYAQAVSQLEEAQRRHAETQREQRIWELAVPLRDVLRHQEAIDEIQRQLDQSKRENAPIFAEVVAAASTLVAVLRARANAYAEEAGVLTRRQADLRAVAEAAQQRALAAAQQLSTAEAREKELDRQRQEAAREHAELVAAGAFAGSETPSEARARLEEISRVAGDEAYALETAAGAAREEATVCDRAVASARQQASEAGLTLRHERELLWRAERVARELSARPVLARALDLSPDHLDVRALGAEAVRELERAAQAVLQREVGDRIEQAEDERALLHLERMNLLPPRRDVERVLGALDLDGNEVSAWSGWRYLETNFLGRVREALRRAPAVADGVIVRDADFKRAVARLEAAALQLDGPVAVVPQSLAHAAADGEEREPAKGANSALAGIVLGPTGDALFDTRAGQDALRDRRQRMEEAARRIDAAQQERTAVAALSVELGNFQAQYPSGWWADRAQAVAEAERAEAEGIARADEASRAAADARARAAQLEQRRREHERAAANAQRLADRVAVHQRRHPAGTAGYEGAIAEQRAAAKSARAGRTAAEQEAKDASAQANELAHDITNAIADQRSAEEEIGRVRHAATDTQAASGGDVDALRQRYQQWLADYEQRVGEEGLRALQQNAVDERNRARRIVQGRLRADVTEADARTALEQLPDRSLADRRLQDAIDAHKVAFGSLGSLGGTTERAKSALESAELEAKAGDMALLAPLTEDERQLAPTDAYRRAAEIEKTAARKREEADEYQAMCRAAESEIRRLTGEEAAVNSQRELVALTRASYASLLVAFLGADTEGQDPPAEAPATDAELVLRVKEVQGALEKAREEHDALDRDRGRIVRQAVALLAEEQFQVVRAQLVMDLRRWDAAEYEDRVEGLLADLAMRTKQIDYLIAQTDIQRDTLVAQALHATEDALRVLTSVERASVVPEHVPGIGGKPFLKSSFKEPTDVAERRLRLGDLIDEVADSGVIPKGIEFVQRCVLRLVRPIEMHVLFPDPDRTPSYRLVTQIGKFSTGQRLTAATLLYLTLASLRARVRWKQQAPTGVLVCDNPFGKASRTAFIEMQREVARRAGVQLIYTTGINDFGALAMLPNVIRLVNSRQDRRTGERLLEQAPDDEGWLAAVRLGRTTVPAARPAPAAASGVVLGVPSAGPPATFGVGVPALPAELPSVSDAAAPESLADADSETSREFGA